MFVSRQCRSLWRWQPLPALVHSAAEDVPIRNGNQRPLPVVVVAAARQFRQAVAEAQAAAEPR